MKRNAPSIIEIDRDFGTEEQCLAYLEAMRWPDGVRCLKCDSKQVSRFDVKESVRTKRYVSKVTGAEKSHKIRARHLFQCLECGHQFSVIAGTIFTDSHLPLSKWFQAIALMCNAKKGLSAKQMERDLGVTYRTAWYLNHRIRKAMEDGAAGLLTGTVEADEMLVGGVWDRRRKTPNAQSNKQTVFGAIQRGHDGKPSKVRSFPVASQSKTVLTAAVKNTISTEADLFITDELRSYRSLGKEYRHETVNHIKLEYVRKGDPRQIHTNSIENFWSLFNRGIVGSFHKVSIKHLRRYLDEFTFRFNNRKAEDLFALVALNLVIGTALRYAELTVQAAQELEPPSEPLGPRSSYEPW